MCSIHIILVLLLFAPQGFSSKPNVLVIIADDVDFQGLKEIPTPNLDKLAVRSLRFTTGYVAHPFFGPTRADIMTGRHQHRFGHENNPDWLPNSATAGLSLAETAFPLLMKQAGYITGAVGKWHLGAHPLFHPNKRRFSNYDPTQTRPRPGFRLPIHALFEKDIFRSEP